MGRLSSFVKPRPNKVMIAAMKHVNRVVMLRGLPLLCDMPGLNRVPPFRGLANVREIDFQAVDAERLSATVGQGKAVFFAPNHPEFFTDWMIDKEILSRVAPMAASWATNTVVNGMGALGQKFWLANNLVAQIPGNSEPARQHSIDWALAGHGVLLHPEGVVGWHADHVAALMPGTVEMGLEALQRGRQTDPDFQVWIAPIVWKLHFLGDVSAELGEECAYVESRLEIPRNLSDDLAGRIYHIYATLLARDEAALGLPAAMSLPYASRQQKLMIEIARRLCEATGTRNVVEDVTAIQRETRRWLRDNAASPQFRTVKSLSETLTRLARVSAFAYDTPEIGQESLAEHLKRIRADYCRGTWRDTVNALVPQPAGPRRAVIRVPQPIGLHEHSVSAQAATELLRERMQSCLDAINDRLKGATVVGTIANPFFQAKADSLAA